MSRLIAQQADAGLRTHSRRPPIRTDNEPARELMFNAIYVEGDYRLGPGGYCRASDPSDDGRPSGLRGLTEGKACRGMRDAESSRNARYDVSERARRRLCRMRGIDFVVGNDAANEKAAGLDKDLADAEMLSLSDSPRLYVLTPNTVAVRRLLLQHRDSQPRSGEDQSHGCPRNSPSDYHDVRKSRI